MSDDTARDEIFALAQGRVGHEIKGKWRLDKLLGVGGMAAVYAATHRNGARAAIKMLHPELSTRGDFAERLVREGYVANRVGHGAVVRVLDDDVDPTDGTVFLVMELLEGETLSARLDREGEIAAGEVLRIMEPLLEALGRAHVNGIVHRDIKPDNIFLQAGGVVRVLDFGIARVESMSKTATRAGVAFGTPAYMAPEQALGRSNMIDRRTDVYACGATMFRMLAGTTAHAGETGQELMIRAATQPARRVGEVKAGVPESVGVIVDRALEFSPKNRYPTAEAMLADVRAAMADLAAGGTGRHATLMGGSAVRVANDREQKRISDLPTVEAASIEAATAALLDDSPPAPAVPASSVVAPTPTAWETEVTPPRPRPGRARALGLALGAAAVVAGVVLAFGLRHTPAPAGHAAVAPPAPPTAPAPPPAPLAPPPGPTPVAAPNTAAAGGVQGATTAPESATAPAGRHGSHHSHGGHHGSSDRLGY